jgi:hypothetical protein
VLCYSAVTSLWEPISAAFSRGLDEIQIRSNGRKCMKVRVDGGNSSGAKCFHPGSRGDGEGGEDFLCRPKGQARRFTRNFGMGEGKVGGNSEETRKICVINLGVRS